ncbi:DR9C7-like protein [Mya arenaria]|uniref:DR9C7-like protein n=1 Tax=Mya arenaria TaxID=6604 RepID=A0ABY7DKS7_MYAAR|nr:DR9C7-like protein [Mya arenaria]
MDRARLAVAAVVVGLALWWSGQGGVAAIWLLGSLGALALYPHKIVRVDPSGKAVFITGCDSGFGNSLARRLFARGYLVFAGCLNPECTGAQKLKADCTGKLHVLSVDVTDEWQVRGAVKYVKENIGDHGLWAVVNNAGVAIFTEIEWCSVLQFQRILDVNVLGVVRVTKAFLPLIRTAQGRVRACIAFSDALRLEMKKFHVKVVTIEPTLYKTPISEKNVLEQQNRKSWSETPPEIKEAYGDEYFDAFIHNIDNQMKRAIPNTTYVIDLMENAVTDVNPQARYVAATPAGKIRAAILSFLPQTITDIIFEKTTPKCLPRQSTSSSVSSASDNDVNSN